MSILVMSNHNSFRVLFDKIVSVYFIWKIYLYFNIENGQPRKPALCQLYRHTFVPYWDSFWLLSAFSTQCLPKKHGHFNDNSRPTSLWNTVSKSELPQFVCAFVRHDTSSIASAVSVVQLSPLSTVVLQHDWLQCYCLQCSDAVGWAAGTASSL